jgi:hypothetical protein
MLPFDVELVKIHIRKNKKEREVSVANARVDAERRKACLVEMEGEYLQLQYMARARQMGFCGGCENILAACSCITMAGNEN